MAVAREQAMTVWDTTDKAILPDNDSASGAVTQPGATLSGIRVTYVNTRTNRKNRCNVTFALSPGSIRVLSAASSVFRKLSGCPPG